MNFKIFHGSCKHKQFYYLTGFLLCLSLTGCEKKQEHQEMLPAEVSVLQVAPKTIFPQETYTARTKGTLQVDVRAQVGGILIEQVYVEGSNVQEGDVLFRIDPAPFEASLNEATASFEDAKARLKYAASEWKRVEKLFKTKAVSTKERDEAFASFNQMRALVEQAEAAVKLAEINLGYATVRAPITGITGQAQVDVGNLIGTSAETNLLTQMTKIDPVYVEFAYPDSAILKFQRITGSKDVNALRGLSLKATLQLADGREYPHEGYVDFTSTEINEKTGSVDARAILPNPKAELIPGQFVRITLKGLEMKNAILIPEKSIMQGPQGTFVLIVDEQNKVQIKPVTLGFSVEKEILIESGLKEGDRIITEGMIKVHPGSIVKITAPPSAASSVVGPQP